MNLLAFCREPNGVTIKRVPVNGALQQPLDQLFLQQETAFRAGRPNEVPFDGDWKPDDDELIVLDNTVEADAMVAAVAGNVLALPMIDTANFETENIKALFVGTNAGGNVKLLVQRFTSAQILNRKFTVLAHNNVFSRLTDTAFSLGSALTCVVENGQIKFESYHNLRAIFDVSEFFAEATDEDIDDFSGHASIEIADIAAFKELATQTERKLIHKLVSTGVLDNHAPQHIQAVAGQTGLAIQIANGRIVFPTEKQEIRRFLRFLDDSLYEAPLSGQRYVTNSKRAV
jgi:hypothetical protein